MASHTHKWLALLYITSEEDVRVTIKQRELMFVTYFNTVIMTCMILLGEVKKNYNFTTLILFSEPFADRRQSVVKDPPRINYRLFSKHVYIVCELRSK